jgi:hypothetical protein
MSSSIRAGRRSRLALVAVGAAAVALLIAPAAGQAKFRFGSKLDSSVQPSNAGTAHDCDMLNPGAPCTWIMNEAYGRPNGGERAQRRGIIRRIRLIAGEAGFFRIQIAKVRQTGPDTYQAKIVRKGPVIHYQGQTQENFDNDVYNVESFKVRIPIKKGQRLAIRTPATSTLRCSSGGANTLLYEPPLPLFGAFRANSDDDGCWELLEAVVVKPPKHKRHRHHHKAASLG